MSNPNLQDVRNRRQEIRKAVSALTIEDQDLLQAEKALLRLGNINEPPLVPLPIIPPPPPVPAPTEASATEPPLPWAANPVWTAPPPPAQTMMPIDVPNEEEEDEDEEDIRVIDVVRSITGGNESLEQLTLLLFRNCSDTWWTAAEIQEHLQILKGKEVPMGSISPMLTAMKNNNVIVRDGLKVALTEKYQEELARLPKVIVHR